MGEKWVEEDGGTQEEENAVKWNWRREGEKDEVQRRTMGMGCGPETRDPGRQRGAEKAEAASRASCSLPTKLSSLTAPSGISQG